MQRWMCMDHLMHISMQNGGRIMDKNGIVKCVNDGLKNGKKFQNFGLKGFVFDMRHANTQAITYLHPECTVQARGLGLKGWTRALDTKIPNFFFLTNVKRIEEGQARVTSYSALKP